MVVVKQCEAVKTLALHISLLILIADASSIAGTESETLPAKVINNENTENISPPIQFPESTTNNTSVQGPPIIQLGNLLNTTHHTVFNKIKKKIGDLGMHNLPAIMTVILNDNDTQYDTHNTSYTDLNNSTNESVNSTESSKPQAKSVKFYNNELSKKSTIIFLVSVALVSTFFYILLVSLRKILERKYGDKQLLVQNEMKPEDFY